MPDLTSLQQHLAPLFPGLMGLQLTEAAADRVCATMLVRPDLCNSSANTLHGGALMAFADTLGAVGTFMSLPRARTTTVDSSTSSSARRRSAARSPASAAFHRGRTTQVWQTLVRTDAGKLCAVVTQTQLVIPG